MAERLIKFDPVSWNIIKDRKGKCEYIRSLIIADASKIKVGRPSEKRYIQLNAGKRDSVGVEETTQTEETVQKSHVEKNFDLAKI